MSTNSYFKRYYPWKISNYKDRFHKGDSPSLNIALLENRFYEIQDFKYAPNYRKKQDILRVTTCGGNLSHGYCKHSIILPNNYNDEKINYVVNGYDLIFSIEPLKTNEETIYQSIETFIVAIPDEWLIIEYKNNNEEFLEMLNKLSPDVKKQTLIRLE